MGDFRDQIMMQIRKDYQEKGNKSFLAEFLLSEKRRKVKEQAEKIEQSYQRRIEQTEVPVQKKKRRNARTEEPAQDKKRERHDLLAEFLWTMEQRKKGGEDWFIEAIVNWIESLQKDDRFTLYYKRESTFVGDMASRGEACREIIKLKKKKRKPSAALLKKASDEITDCLLEQIIPQWLYNLGCPLYSPGEYKSGRQSSARNTALDLIDAWCSTHGTGGVGAPSGIEGNGFGAQADTASNVFDANIYQELYDLLNKEHRTGALIPVRIDPETGVGIYIVGRELYANEAEVEMLRFQYVYGKRGNNYAARSCGIEVVGYWQPAESADQSGSISLGDPDGTLYGFLSITEANTWFLNLIRGDQELRFSGFKEPNGDPPAGLPERFRKYFEKSPAKPSDDFDQLTDEDLAETRAIFQAE